MANYYVLTIADSLEGHAADKVASAIAISALKDAMRDCDSPKIALENTVLTTDEQIRAQSKQNKDRRGMATTLIAACVDDALNCTVINGGDSRAHIITSDLSESV
jgi:serine/threonine protein phosphatase PrpC